jgi:hypothetical protein
MKTRIFLRVAKNGYKTKVEASTKSNEEPVFLPKKYNRERVALPTVGFAVDFEIPDELFSRASVVVATINIATKDAKVLSGVPNLNKVK